MNNIIFWDFHGTLGYNDWMFSKALHKVLISYEPNSSVGIEDFKRRPMSGFSWQNCDKEYLHLTDGTAWWKHAENIFIDCYKGFNITEENAVQYAQDVRGQLTKVDGFILYEDTIEMLNYFKEKGYTNIILSNHVPELPRIVEELGLSPYLLECISSANVGYEKPNTKIYEYALEKYNNPKEVWMVGDSISADVKGAESVGIKGVLVRSTREDGIRYYSKDLLGLREIIK